MTDPRDWATLFTRARKRKGWSLLTLSVRAEVPFRTTRRACQYGQITTTNAGKLMHALNLSIPFPDKFHPTGPHAHS